MSSSDLRRTTARVNAASRFGLMAIMLALPLGACQVTPLYADRSAPGYDMAARPAADIVIPPVDDRLGQELRNQLIFLLHGGAGEPATARYSVDLTVDRQLQGILRDPIDGQPTGQNLIIRAEYAIIDTATGEPVALRRQSVTTSYDDFDQGFADLRAARDAENRAAKELAERIRADLALFLNAEATRGAAQGT